MIFTAIIEQIERSARNGTRAHLAPELSRALIESPAYSMIIAERTKELVSTWHDDSPPAASEPNPIEPSSGHSGSGIGPIATTGASVGTMTEPELEAVGRAASQRASEAVKGVGRRRRHKTP